MSKASREEYRRWREKKEDTRLEGGELFATIVVLGMTALAVVAAIVWR